MNQKCFSNLFEKFNQKIQLIYVLLFLTHLHSSAFDSAFYCSQSTILQNLQFWLLFLMDFLLTTSATKSILGSRENNFCLISVFCCHTGHFNFLFYIFRCLFFSCVIKVKSLNFTKLVVKFICISSVWRRQHIKHGLRTPNEGINQRNLKIWADVADKKCFGRT